MSSVKSATTSTSAAPRRREIKRPDDKAIKEEIEKLKDEIKKLDLTNNEINAQIAKAQIDQKVMDKRNKLQTELKSLIAKQSQGKNERQLINDQIKAIDASMKKRIAEIQQQTSKNNFKNVAEIDSRINYLDGLIDAGNLKLADERRFVKEMSSLRKLRKDFGSIEKTQELIDQDKAKIAELKKKLSATHNKEVQAQFETIQKELDAINESNKTIISKRDELRDKRTEIKKQKDAKYEQIRKIRSDFDEKFASFKKQLAEEKKRRDEEYKQRLLEEKQQKKKVKRNWLKLPFQLSPRKSIPSTLCCLTLTHLMSNQPRKPKPMVLYQSITTLERLNSQKTLLSLKRNKKSFLLVPKVKRVNNTKRNLLNTRISLLLQKLLLP